MMKLTELVFHTGIGLFLPHPVFMICICHLGFNCRRTVVKSILYRLNFAKSTFSNDFSDCVDQFLVTLEKCK